MSLIHALVRLFPYWAFPMALVFGEVAWTLRKKRASFSWQLFCWGAALVLVGLTVAWFAYRGDLYSDKWVRSVFSMETRGADHDVKTLG